MLLTFFTSTGAIYTVTRLIQVDHEVHGSEPDLEPTSECVTLRRYAGMALTNLTFGDATTKTLLCSFKQFLKVLILQLQIQCEDLRQVYLYLNIFVCAVYF